MRNLTTAKRMKPQNYVISEFTILKLQRRQQQRSKTEVAKAVRWLTTVVTRRKLAEC